jgi:hypothetical protein
MQQALETRSNEISLCGHCGGAGIYSPLDRIRLVATNGRSTMHLPSALPRVQWSALSHNPLSKRGPSGLSQIAGEVIRRMVGRQTSVHESVNESAYLARSSNCASKK